MCMFTSIEEVQRLMEAQSYIADRALATTLFLAIKLEKPIFLEGEAGVGKTEVAKVLAHIIFGEEFLLKRPLLDAIMSDGATTPVLLIDEVDRSDEEFEAFLLEVLSDFQITIPE